MADPYPESELFGFLDTDLRVTFSEDGGFQFEPTAEANDINETLDMKNTIPARDNEGTGVIITQEASEEGNDGNEEWSDSNEKNEEWSDSNEKNEEWSDSNEKNEEEELYAEEESSEEEERCEEGNGEEEEESAEEEEENGEEEEVSSEEEEIGEEDREGYEGYKDREESTDGDKESTDSDKESDDDEEMGQDSLIGIGIRAASIGKRPKSVVRGSTDSDKESDDDEEMGQDSSIGIDNIIRAASIGKRQKSVVRGKKLLPRSHKRASSATEGLVKLSLNDNGPLNNLGKSKEKSGQNRKTSTSGLASKAIRARKATHHYKTSPLGGKGLEVQKFLEKNRKDRHNLFRRGMAVGCRGLFGDTDETAPDHMQYQGLTIGPMTREVLKENMKAGWEPSVQAQLLVFKRRRRVKNGVIEEAVELFLCFSAEQGTSVWEVFRLFAVDLRYEKQEHTYQTSFRKVILRSNRKYAFGDQDPKELLTSVKLTIDLLVNYVEDVENNFRNGQTPGFNMLEEQQKMKRSKKCNQNAKNLKAIMNKQLELFYIGVMIFDYIFEFTDKDKKRGAERLVIFFRKCMFNVFSKKVIWRFYDTLLRLFYKKSDKDDPAKKLLLKNMLDKPEKAVELVKQETSAYDPDDYQYEIRKEMIPLYGLEVQVYLHMIYSVKDTDMFILRWHVLKQIYIVRPIQKIVDGKLTTIKLLFIRDSTEAQRQEQIKRHRSNNMYEAAKAAGWYGEKEKRKKRTVVNPLLIQAEQGSHEEEEDNTKESPFLAQLFDEEKDDDGFDEEEDNDLDQECDIDGKLNTNNDNNNLEGYDDMFAMFNSDENNVNNEPIDMNIDEDNNSINMKNINNELIDNIDHKKLKFDKLINKSWMKKNSYVLNIKSGLLTNIHVESSRTQLVFTNLLTICEHGVCKRIAVKQMVIRYFDTQTHFWIPACNSHENYNFGVIRPSHQIFQKQRKHMKKMAFDPLINFLVSNGTRDKHRDCSTATTYRYDFGYSSLDYSQESVGHMRTPPSLNNLDLIIENVKVKEQISLILEIMNNMLLMVAAENGYPEPLTNSYIYEFFTKRFNELLGCKLNRFQAVTLGLTLMSVEEFTQVTGSSQQICLTKWHSDDQNGLKNNNNHSCIYHTFILLKDDKGNEMVGRLFVIGYTRKSLEYFQDNETSASPLKAKLNNYAEEVEAFFSSNDTNMGSFIKLATIEDVILSNMIHYQDVTITPKPNHGEPFARRYFRYPALYSPELTYSPAITIIHRFFKKTRNVKKALELILLALYPANWLKFYYGGLEFLKTVDKNYNGSPYVDLWSIMENKFAETNPPLENRCHNFVPSQVRHYLIPENRIEAIDRIYHVLTELNNDSRMRLKEYKQKMIQLSHHIKGVAHFRIQRLPILAICSGVVLTDNIHYGTFGFPSTTGGVSLAALDAYRQEIQESYRRVLQHANFVLNRDDEKIAKIICKQIGLKETRTSWSEFLLCEGVGRKDTFYDYVFFGQDLFAIFNVGEGLYQVKYKRFNSLIWVDLDM